MSEARKAFESHVNQYDTFGDEWQDKGVDEHFIAGYEAGKAARAGQESEPFAFCFTDVNGKPSEFCDHPKHAAEGDTRIRTPLYTHPTKSDEWIKCSDRLPAEYDGDFEGLVWANDRDMTLPKYAQSRIHWSRIRGIAGYTHWMPTGFRRPQPPKQEGE